MDIWQKFKKAEELARYINEYGFTEVVVDIDGTILNTHIAALVYRDFLGIVDADTINNVCAYIPDNVDCNKVETFLREYTWFFAEPVTLHLLRRVKIPISIKTRRSKNAIPKDISTKFKDLTNKELYNLYTDVRALDFSSDVCLIDDFPKFFSDYKPRDWDICVKRAWSWETRLQLEPLTL